MGAKFDLSSGIYRFSLASDMRLFVVYNCSLFLKYASAHG